jgi:FtsH-binding integral membrane protein
MESSTFFKWLAVVTLGTAGVLAGLHLLLPEAQAHWKFSVASLVLFTLVCTGLFFAGESAARSKSRVAFINLVSGSVFGKMVLAVAFLFVYQRIAKPENEWFVGIFLWCYVVYTGFEIWFMTRLART